jgi:N-acetylglucosaminyldiphosphoundecaprenol N-acetyl-beta-D-mannosaminyltransferase
MTRATFSAEPCAPPSARVVSIRVDATSYPDAAGRILAWAGRRESRYVCVATVNNVMQAHDDPAFRAIMNEADLVTPDGMPLVWALRLFGVHGAARVYGPDLMRFLLAEAERSRTPVALYGGSAEALERLTIAVHSRHPELKIAYGWSPPFRALTAEEDAAVVDDINKSRAGIVFVGLSTPKQERWMAAHRGSISAPMIGVGAAFDFLSGSKPQAPRWMMRSGLEWLFRLATEPRRLGRRYLAQNPRYVALFAADCATRCFRKQNR